MTQTAETATRPEWEGFKGGIWQDAIDVRDFIQKNYTPYEGDSEFLAGETAKTRRVWETLEEKYLSVERQKRVYDVDVDTPADVDAFGQAIFQKMTTLSSDCKLMYRSSAQ